NCDPAALPYQDVALPHGFWMGRTEVTVGAYKRFAEATGRALPRAPSFDRDWRRDELPMVSVPWETAGALCAWGGGPLASEAGGSGSGRTAAAIRTGGTPGGARTRPVRRERATARGSTTVAPATSRARSGWRRTRRTDSVSTTWPATSGNGTRTCGAMPTSPA